MHLVRFPVAIRIRTPTKINAGIQNALSLGLNPLVLLIPEVFASNVIGISTLTGTPTSILIGSYARLSFNDFLANRTPGVLMAFIGLVIYCYFA